MSAMWEKNFLQFHGDAHLIVYFGYSPWIIS